MTLEGAQGRCIVAALLVAATLAGAEPNNVEATPQQIERQHTRIDAGKVPKVTTAIKIDGRLDDPAWRQALKVRLEYETDPGENTAAPIDTECSLAYDDTHLFVGCNAVDPEPERIRARLSDRDTAFGDDFVGVVLDTFNDERRAFEFFVNPLGVQMDMVYDDLQGSEDSSWDAIWDSGGQLHESGYSVEMKIPFSQLRFQKVDGDQTWGLDVMRSYPRSRRHRLGLNPLERGLSCYLCQAATVSGFADASPGKNLQITPTIVAVRTDDLQRDNFPDGGLTNGEEDIEPGLTARWGVTNNMTLLGTLNPDFSQVEADAALVNVNQSFALFFPERRPFFLEGADFFETPLNVLYTRNVQSPDWGAKLTGKQGPNTLGVFLAQDERTSYLRPGLEGSGLGDLPTKSFDGVLRYRRDVGETSAVGVIATARQSEDFDYSNTMVGADVLYRPNGANTFSAQILQSDTTDPFLRDAGTPDDSSDDFYEGVDSSDAAYFLRYSHNKRNYNLRASRVSYGEDFRADLGFISRVDYTQDVIGGSYRFWGGADRWFNRIGIGGDWDQTNDDSGRFVESEWEGWVDYSGPKQSYAFLGSGFRNRQFNGDNFEQEFLSIWMEAQPFDDLYLGLSVNSGDALDQLYRPEFGRARQGRRLRVAPELTWRAGRNLRLSLSHDYRTLDLEPSNERPSGTGERLFTANVTEMRAVYQFNVRTFIRLITQYQDLEQNPDLWIETDPGTGAALPDPDSPGEFLRLRNVNPNEKDLFNQFLFSYKINPQTAVFFGYSDARSDAFGFENTAEDLRQINRSFFVKLGYAWLP